MSRILSRPPQRTSSANDMYEGNDNCDTGLYITMIQQHVQPRQNTETSAATPSSSGLTTTTTTCGWVDELGPHCIGDPCVRDQDCFENALCVEKKCHKYTPCLDYVGSCYHASCSNDADCNGLRCDNSSCNTRRFVTSATTTAISVPASTPAQVSTSVTQMSTPLPSPSQVTNPSHSPQTVVPIICSVVGAVFLTCLTLVIYFRYKRTPQATTSIVASTVGIAGSSFFLRRKRRREDMKPVVELQDTSAARVHEADTVPPIASVYELDNTSHVAMNEHGNEKTEHLGTPSTALSIHVPPHERELARHELPDTPTPGSNHHGRHLSPAEDITNAELEDTSSPSSGLQSSPKTDQYMVRIHEPPHLPPPASSMHDLTYPLENTMSVASFDDRERQRSDAHLIPR